MNIKYNTQNNVPIADCLSRLIDMKSAEGNPTLNLQITDLGLDHDVNINFSEIRMMMMMNDPTLVRLAHAIQQGWPQTNKELPNDVKVYFPYRFVLHIVDGIIVLHNRIMVPGGLRHHILDKIYRPHLGIVDRYCVPKLWTYLLEIVWLLLVVKSLIKW